MRHASHLAALVLGTLAFCLLAFVLGGCTLRAQTRAAGSTRELLNADAETIEVSLRRTMDGACDLDEVPVQPDASRDACVQERLEAVDTTGFRRWRATHDTAVIAWREWVEAIAVWSADLAPFETVMAALRGLARVWCDLSVVAADHGEEMPDLPSIVQRAVDELGVCR